MDDILGELSVLLIFRYVVSLTSKILDVVIWLYLSGLVFNQ